jgi:glycosyltransferase involved in cell wall biosynthesis
MKIIFIDAVQNFGGASKSTLELAKRLINEKNEVLVVDYWGCCAHYISQCIKDNIPYEVLDYRKEPIILSDKGTFNKIINYIKYLKINLEYKKKLQKIIKGFKPDLVSVHGTKTLAILSKSKEYKIAFFARGWFLPKTFGILERSLLKSKVDLYLSVSQATRHMVYVSGLAPLENIYVITGAIEQDKIKSLQSLNNSLQPWFKEKEGSREFILMHCGSFIETKGQHVALEVLKKLLYANQRVKLVLVGMITPSSSSKLYYDSILNYIKENKLESNVDILLNESDVLKYYRNIDLLLHPSYSEGLPRVVLESMSFGKPVVANAVGGVIDVVINNYTGYLCNFNAIDEYVFVIKNLIADKNKYEFLSKNAASLIEMSYTNKNQVSEFMKVQNYLKG